MPASGARGIRAVTTSPRPRGPGSDVDPAIATAIFDGDATSADRELRPVSRAREGLRLRRRSDQPRAPRGRAERPALGSSTSGASILARSEPWVARLQARYDFALDTYLADVQPGRERPFELESYAFFNYTDGSSFTPVHDHLVEADLVAIYYAHAPRIEEVRDTSYYAMGDGLLVLHDPRPDSRADRRALARDHFRVHPGRTASCCTRRASATR